METDNRFQRFARNQRPSAIQPGHSSNIIGTIGANGWVNRGLRRQVKCHKTVTCKPVSKAKKPSFPGLAIWAVQNLNSHLNGSLLYIVKQMEGDDGTVIEQRWRARGLKKRNKEKIMKCYFVCAVLLTLLAINAAGCNDGSDQAFKEFDDYFEWLAKNKEKTVCDFGTDSITVGNSYSVSIKNTDLKTDKDFLIEVKIGESLQTPSARFPENGTAVIQFEASETGQGIISVFETKEKNDKVQKKIKSACSFEVTGAVVDDDPNDDADDDPNDDPVDTDPRCYMCQAPDRRVKNPDHEFQMNDTITGKTYDWTCGFLAESVADVYAEGGAAGEARWCALNRLWFDRGGCECYSSPIKIDDSVKDPNPACDLCQSPVNGEPHQLDHVPEILKDELVETGIAGRMPCGGLYHAAAEGVLSKDLCPIVQKNAGTFCCNLPVVEE